HPLDPRAPRAVRPGAHAAPPRMSTGSGRDVFFARVALGSAAIDRVEYALRPAPVLRLAFLVPAKRRAPRIPLGVEIVVRDLERQVARVRADPDAHPSPLVVETEHAPVFQDALERDSEPLRIGFDARPRL